MVIGLAVVLVAATAAVLTLKSADDPAGRSTSPPLMEMGQALARPTVDYSGNLEITAGVISLVGPVRYTPEMESRALQLRGTQVPARTVITRRGEETVWIVDPATRSYLRAPLTSIGGSPDSLIVGNITESEKLGDETIDGIDVARFRVSFEGVDDTKLSGEIWITGDNIVLRMEGAVEQGDRTTPIIIQLSDLVIAPQPSEYFEPPEDYTLVPTSHPTMGLMATPGNPPAGTTSSPEN